MHLSKSPQLYVQWVCFLTEHSNNQGSSIIYIQGGGDFEGAGIFLTPPQGGLDFFTPSFQLFSKNAQKCLFDHFRGFRLIF